MPAEGFSLTLCFYKRLHLTSEQSFSIMLAQVWVITQGWVMC